MEEYIYFRLEDGREFRLPILVVAKHRAEFYSKYDGISFEESLNEDTIPLFKSAPYEIKDWLVSNMDYQDYKNKLEFVGTWKEVENPLDILISNCHQYYVK